MMMMMMPCMRKECFCLRSWTRIISYLSWSWFYLLMSICFGVVTVNSTSCGDCVFDQAKKVKRKPVLGWLLLLLVATSDHQKFRRRKCTEPTQIDIRNSDVEDVLSLHKSSRDKIYFWLLCTISTKCYRPISDVKISPAERSSVFDCWGFHDLTTAIVRADRRHTTHVG